MKKKDMLILLLLLICSLGILLFVKNDYFLYKEDIIRITNIKKIKINSEANTLGIVENYYKEDITGTLLNGKHKGDIIKVTNESTSSNVISESYNKGDIVFIKDSMVDGLKRDTYIVFMILIFIISIYIVGLFKGIASIISVIFNISLFTFGLNFYFKGFNLILLLIIESFIFTIFSLVISNGFTKKTKSAVISVFISVIVLTLLVLSITLGTNYNGINFNGMSFLTVPPEDVFTAEIIIGGLGAIMDVAITISSSFDELLQKNKNMRSKDLIKSSRDISKDIMGTMINVLFFTYLCGGLPTFVLALRNGFSLTNYIISNYSLELTRFLTGSIGIVLTIPISIFICLKTYKKEANV